MVSLAEARALLFATLACAATTALGCGGNDALIVDGPSRKVNDEWPAAIATPPADATSVTNVLAAADGAVVHVRGYLVATTLPCPACNTSLGTRQFDSAPKEKEEAIGRARTPVAVPGPGCEPCPPQAATFSDEQPRAAAKVSSGPLRATGAALGLQPRHVGHQFVLTGTFHARGAQGPELEVTDVQALPDRSVAVP